MGSDTVTVTVYVYDANDLVRAGLRGLIDDGKKQVVSGIVATPSEAVSWGKIDPEQLPGTVVAYVDATVALPIITAYALARHEPREPKRLYDRRDEFMNLLKKEYDKSTRR